MIPQPLDYTPKKDRNEPKVDRLRTLGNYLELAPILILCGGMLMQTQGIPNWKPVILFGGGVAVVIYTIFSYYMFQLEKYTTIEFTLGLFSAVLFPLGISGIVFPEYSQMGDTLAYGIYGSAILLGIGMILFIYNITDPRASVFYRSLIARVMVFGAILLRLWY